MKKVEIKHVSLIQKNESVEGISIEEKIRVALQDNTPIDGGSPLIYTKRADGVRPEYDIRTDRFDIAIEQADKLANAKLLARQKVIENEKNSFGDESINDNQSDINK